MVHIGKIQQPEAIAFNSKGEIFCSSVTGFIHKVDLEKGIDEAWLFVGGRPLDLAFDKDDNLYVCVSTIGLLKIDGKTKDMTILSSYAEEGGAIRYANVSHEFEMKSERYAARSRSNNLTH